MEIFQEIISSLRKNRLRTILTGLSVAWGIFILVVLLGAGKGVENGSRDNLSKRATNSVTVWANRTSKPYKGLKPNRVLKFGQKEVQDISSTLTNTDEISGVIDRSVQVTYGKESIRCNMKGVDPPYFKINNIELDGEGGRVVNNLDIDRSSKVIVLDYNIKKSLFGEREAIGKRVKVGPVVFTVIGVAEKKQEWGNGSVFIPFTICQRIYNPNGKFHNITMTTKDLESKESNEEYDNNLKSLLAKNVGFDETDNSAVWISNSMENYLQAQTIFRGISIFIIVVGILTLIAGVVGVSNIMLVSVKERTREIGIRKAIGASPRSIILSVVLESVIITAIFGYVGMLLGIGVTELVNGILESGKTLGGSFGGMDFSIFKNPTVELKYVLVSTIILIASGVVAGYIPAKRAVKISPIEAMREE